ncbi:hypothetical protein DCS_08242 [Drechmeria coniospora]|uniref:Uncharacterized protein n=1 Tax=Drechmeria coniospora TaxID=98403 RepID=A0A151GGT0_DRECN|nr:hypothetical protein DCS_08242 [Drechmeria coniospora]KYK56272.1 hypothetical protein DCS_08242 [Drechmeria coniospora]
MSNHQWYGVYKIKFKLAMQDPDMPSPRFHTLIFVETNAQGPGTGTKHHVTGDIVKGMYYESKPYHNPDKSESLHSKELIGHTNASNYPHDFDKILKAVPPPSKQKAFNHQSMRTEPVKSWEPLTFYKPGEPRQPLVKCTEWTEQRAIPALGKYGLVQQR